MKFTELKKHLSVQVLPAYLAVGEDDYLLRLVRQMFESKIELAQFNIGVFCDCADTGALIAAAEALPVMSGLRLIVAENFRGDSAPLLKYLKNPNPSSVILFLSPSLTQNFSAVASKLEVIDCARLDAEILKEWISSNLKKNGATITVRGAELLIEFCARHLGRISTEVQKLSDACGERMITHEDVEELVHADLEYKIFELSEAISLKQPRRVAVLLSALTESGTPPVSLMGLLYSHFRRLLYCGIGSPALAQNLGIKEYAVKKSTEQAKRFTPRRLKSICDSFHKADFDFKSGNMTDRTALETFIMAALNIG